MKKLFASILSIGLILALLSGMSVTAIDLQTSDYANFELEPEIPFAEQFETFLLEAQCEEERLLVLLRAATIGLDASEISSTSLTRAETAMLDDADAIFEAIMETRRPPPNMSILTAPESAFEAHSAIAPSSIVAGIPMPDFALRPIIRRQERSYFCSVASIYLRNP